MAREMYAVVRKTDGKEWIDGESLALLPEQVREDIKKVRGKIPFWDKDNPPIRIVKVALTEVETLEEF